MSEAKVLDPELEELEEQEPAVLDDYDAEYLLKRRRQAVEQYERMKTWYAKQLEKAEEIMNRTLVWADRGLREYLETTAPAKITKSGQRIYDLPSGKLTLKPQEPDYDRKDEELVPWLKANKLQDLVKVKETADWAALKKQLKIGPDGRSMVTGDGEIVPGITVTDKGLKFAVTMKGGE